MSACGYGAEMCACAAYGQLLDQWDRESYRESALERETADQRADLDAWRIGALLAELAECGRPALARALDRWLDAYAAHSAEAKLTREAESWRRGDYCGD